MYTDKKNRTVSIRAVSKYLIASVVNENGSVTMDSVMQLLQ
jgi:hypothetical protein